MLQRGSSTVVIWLYYLFPLFSAAPTVTARNCSSTGTSGNFTTASSTIRRQCWSKGMETGGTSSIRDGLVVYESSQEETIFLDMSHISLDGSVCLSEADFLIVVEDEEDVNEYDANEEEEEEDWEDWEEEEEEEEDWDDVSTSWPYWDRTRFREYYNCTADFSQERPIPTEDFWIELRRTYANVVPYVQSTIYPMAPLASDNGFQFRVHVAQSPGRGRGVFANEFIPKNSLVYKSRWDGVLPNSHSYRQLLWELPADTACQVMVWSYLQDLSSLDDDEQKNITLIANLDIGALVNGGDWDDWPNIGCVPEVAQSVPGGCKRNDFALDDIFPGDELLSDYGEFVDQSWSEFGLQCDDCN